MIVGVLRNSRHVVALPCPPTRKTCVFPNHYTMIEGCAQIKYDESLRGKRRATLAGTRLLEEITAAIETKRTRRAGRRVR